jgi:hypothetical protein
MALVPVFTVELHSHSGSKSHKFSAAIPIAERISLSPSSSLLLLDDPPLFHIPIAVQSIVESSHNFFHWTMARSDFPKVQWCAGD